MRTVAAWAVAPAQRKGVYERLPGAGVITEVTRRLNPVVRVRALDGAVSECPLGELTVRERMLLFTEGPRGLKPAWLWLTEQGLPFTVHSWEGVFRAANERCERVLTPPDRIGLDPHQVFAPYATPHSARHILFALLPCRDNRHRWASGPAACAVRLPLPRCRLSRNHVGGVSLQRRKPTATRISPNTASAERSRSFALYMLVSLNKLMDQKYGLSEEERRDFRQLYGDPWFMVQQLLGHASRETTVHRYLAPVADLNLRSMLAGAASPAAAPVPELDEAFARVARESDGIQDLGGTGDFVAGAR